MNEIWERIEGIKRPGYSSVICGQRVEVIEEVPGQWSAYCDGGLGGDKAYKSIRNAKAAAEKMARSVSLPSAEKRS